ncbi:MAG: prephenate dehydrogenase/arogenate dehydrogenase family protein [Candidatus Rokuibacteriota bacterium]|nr:MAG: prephenate dehydrogenase/arogenate dehydrogenase family protein [Candidatus Rokubacteria bacterium]
MPADDRGRPPFPLRRVRRSGPSVHALARELHPRRRRAKCGRRLQLAAQGRRDRPADDELRHGDLSARERRHARGEPPLREGAQKGPGRGEEPVIRRLTLVGLGLLGGSVAKAARAEGLAREIVAVGRSRERMAPALEDGVVDRITTDLAEGLAGAEFCVLATPVATLASLLAEVWRVAPADVVLTDVGSTKAAIVRVAEALGRSRPLAFVGSHPMAGSEKSGYRVARVDLFRGARVIVTPTESTDPGGQKRVTDFWEAIGARVTTLDPLTHDRAVAAISHLPHLVADALVDAVVRLDPHYLDVAGPGFRDTTRIAAGSPEVWREIFHDNRPALGEALGAFRCALDELERVVASGDPEALERELDRIKRVRDALA